MKKKDLKSYINRLEKAHYFMSKYWEPEVSEENDLTKTQIMLLRTLSERDRWTVTELAEMLGVKPSAITVGADRLFKKGFIARYRSDLDRRIVYLEITEDGQRVLDEAEDKRLAVISSYLDKLSKDELDLFLSVYEKISAPQTELIG